MYYPVSPRKFIALSVLTFGLYELYWFYKNWSFVRARDGSDIMPWARAVFAPLWYPALLGDLRASLQQGPIVPGGRFVPAVAYFVLVSCSQLPDPFWLVGFLSFAALLPVVHRINAANPEPHSDYGQNSSWRPRHLVLALFALPILGLTAGSAIGLLPSTQVVPGWMIWGPSRNFLEHSGIVEPDEKIHYFYSDAVLSFEGDGNLLTDRRVISYWTDNESHELQVEAASFSQIAETEVERGNFLDPTVLTVVRMDGSEFFLVLSTEERRDRLFLKQLEALRP